MYKVEILNKEMDPAEPVNMYEYMLTSVGFLYLTDAIKYFTACREERKNAGADPVIYRVYNEEGQIAYTSKCE